MTLVSIFQGSKIVGVEVDEGRMQVASKRAREAGLKNISVVRTLNEVQGKFDVVLALSVFCRWPAASELQNISSLLSFKDFEEGLSSLISRVKPGGLMAIYNSHFAPEDVSRFSEFTPAGLVGHSVGFVNAYDAEGLRVTKSEQRTYLPTPIN